MFEFSSTENTEMNFYHEFVKEFNDQNKQTKNSLKYKKNNNFFFRQPQVLIPKILTEKNIYF